MKHLKFFILLTFTGLSTFVGAQQDIEKLKATTTSIEPDSALKLVDIALFELAAQEASFEDKLPYFKLKEEVANAAKNREFRHQVYAIYIQHPESFSEEDQIKHLKSEGNYLVKNSQIDAGIQLQLKALKIAESSGNKAEQGTISKRIGINYLKINSFDISERFLLQAIEIFDEIGDTASIMYGYMSLGNAFKERKMFEEALAAYDTSITIATYANISRGLAGNYNNIGNVLRRQGKPKEALEYYFDALEINLIDSNYSWVSYNYNNIGNSYEDLGNDILAIDYFRKSTDIKIKLGETYSLMASYNNLGDTYAKIHDYKNAYHYNELYVALKDSLMGVEKLKQATELETKYQTEKKEEEIKKLNAEKNIQSLTIENQHNILEKEKLQNQRNSTIIGASAVALLLVTLLSFILWRGNQLKRRHNQELNQSKLEIEKKNEVLNHFNQELELKNQEITDSIKYAHLIQNAALPNITQLQSLIKSFCLFYKPKDIVSGDFYFAYQYGNKTICGIADCTGHGVPGAMVSLIGINALDKVIKEGKGESTGNIIAELNEEVKQKLNRNQNTINDGMDLTLCSVDYDKEELEFSGANHSIFISRSNQLLHKTMEFYESRGLEITISNKNDTHHIFKVSGTRRPIGNSLSKVPFETINVPLLPKDRLFMFTDGYADQIGGSRGKKLKKRNFTKFLNDNASNTFESLERSLEDHFNGWKDSFEQIDDICVFGIEI